MLTTGARDPDTGNILDSLGHECLRQLRAELAASYPVVRPRALVRIARRLGRSVFPPGFFVSGSLEDRSRSGPLAKLRSANTHQDGTATDWHPLFSSSFYLLVNPDVALAGASPWLHYQAFGRIEGRSPHPLLDPHLIGEATPLYRSEQAIDEYLANRDTWFANPSPYVDIGNFVVHGNWDGSTHPLVQLVTQQSDGPWINRRLLAVDSTSDSLRNAKLVAAGYLLTGAEGRSRLAETRYYRPSPSAPEGAGDYVVIPGHTLAFDGRELSRLGTQVVSPDSTAVRLEEGTVVALSGASIKTDRLIVLTGPASFATLNSLVLEARAGASIAPASRAQETALRQIRRDLNCPKVTVLEYGRQVIVKAGTAETRAHAAVEVEECDLISISAPHGIAVVLPISARRRATGDHELRTLLSQGASLCLVDENGLNSWLPIIQNRREALVDVSLIDDVASFVDEASIRRLQPWRRI